MKNSLKALHCNELWGLVFYPMGELLKWLKALRRKGHSNILKMGLTDSGNIYGGNFQVNFYIKEIKSVSDYYAHEGNKLRDNEPNKEVNIKISEADDKGYELPRHLIITGINGTGKTVLLESVHQGLRKKYTDLTGNSISHNPDKAVDTKLIFFEKFCGDDQKYFEPLFITIDDMFMPTKHENFNDYANFLFKMAMNSEVLLSDLNNAIGELYGDEFEKLDVEANQIKIKLKGRPSFEVNNMSSGHYSFLNVYCHIRFSQFAFQWEDKDLWSFLKVELKECKRLSETISDKLASYKSNHTQEQSRDLEETIKSETGRTRELSEAVSIAESRYETIQRIDVNEHPRSRARDRDIAIDVWRALQTSKNTTYSRILRNIPELSIMAEFNMLTEKLEECAGRLLGGKLDIKDFPLIILIDEPESHLHIALQRTILPYLVKCFKNAQFIVATHSPFVITSLAEATLFNMENRERLIADLTLYSYQNIVEGWFDLSIYSDETIKTFKKFKELAGQDSKLTDNERDTYQKLYEILIQTDLCSAVIRLNLRKEIKDGEIYVLR